MIDESPVRGDAVIDEAVRMIGRRQPPPVEERAKPKGFDDFDLRLGDVMRGERATMGKSLLDVQRDLKIKATYIAAIENADPTAFETQGFVAGYVRSYARYLGLDPEWAYARFCAEGEFTTSHGMSPAASVNRSTSSDRPRPKIRDPFADSATVFIPKGIGLMSRIEPSAIGSTLVLMMLISVIGYGGWSVFQEIQKVQFAPVDQAPGVTSNVDILETNDAVLAAINDNSGFELPTADALDRLYRPEALDVPVLVARDGPISTIDPSSVGTYTPVTSPPDRLIADRLIDLPTPRMQLDLAEDLVQVVAADIPEIVLFAVRPSWVRVQGSDGTVIFEKILDAGERYILPKTEDAPTLRAGNAGSVYFAVNGENYGPAGTGPSVIKNVLISSEAVKQKYEVADLSKDNDLARFVAVAEAQDAAPAE